MDHYIFECEERTPFISKHLTLYGWRSYLYSGTWTGKPDYRCAFYKIVSEDPPMFKMVISGKNSCDGLLKRMEQSEQAVPKGSRLSADGTISLLFSRDFPVVPMWSPSKRMEQSEEAVPEGFQRITDGSITLIIENSRQRLISGPSRVI
ncbi:unnamed protein product [Macrosiphum euphorbiae]|uniref:Uncharacterized protein n=1 Tax=Macrosiphum euphorbiae TaxID=13131 RepID=A0AAV0W9L7_9HEMI|nr:unnamed protein product [Macrosiphum euphorbiae]